MSGVKRQGKIKGRETWLDCGDVTIEDAAIMVCQHAQLATDVCYVIVRDVDTPATEYEFKVESSRAYRVTNLRQGA
jgi:hypothetical protein